MPRFCANLTFLFTELPFLDRFEAAAKAGFKAIEAGNPYEASAADVASRLRTHGLAPALFNTPAGNAAAASADVRPWPAASRISRPTWRSR
jgi:hydroxypyruvate isomerase